MRDRQDGIVDGGAHDTGAESEQACARQQPQAGRRLGKSFDRGTAAIADGEVVDGEIGRANGFVAGRALHRGVLTRCRTVRLRNLIELELAVAGGYRVNRHVASLPSNDRLRLLEHQDQTPRNTKAERAGNDSGSRHGAETIPVQNSSRPARGSVSTSYF